MKTSIKTFQQVLVAAIIVVSCVSKKKYEAAISEVDRLRADSTVMAERVVKLEAKLQREIKKNPVNKIKKPFKSLKSEKKKDKMN